jgi:hypothetical protein
MCREALCVYNSRVMRRLPAKHTGTSGRRFMLQSMESIPNWATVDSYATASGKPRSASGADRFGATGLASAALGPGGDVSRHPARPDDSLPRRNDARLPGPAGFSPDGKEADPCRRRPSRRNPRCARPVANQQQAVALAIRTRDNAAAEQRMRDLEDTQAVIEKFIAK